MAAGIIGDVPQQPAYEPHGPREECGVVGIHAPGFPVARLTYVGLHALQHRGQESAGIAVSDGARLTLHKRLGLVSQVFDEETLSRLEHEGESERPQIAIGHTRYSTTGSNSLPNVQPVEEVAKVIADLISEPRADVYSRPGYQQLVIDYFGAKDLGEVEKKPPFVQR